MKKQEIYCLSCIKRWKWCVPFDWLCSVHDCWVWVCIMHSCLLRVPAGGLRFVTTPKGRTVVIHNGHMYTLSHQTDTKTTWVCVMQRKLNCSGCVMTAGISGAIGGDVGPTLLSYSGHNHAQLNDIIQRLDCTTVASYPNPLSN